MPSLKQLSREILYNRHRLSHQQIDDFLSESSSKKYLGEKMEQMAMVGEFLRVTDAFKEAGIESISLKGPVLSYRLYNDASYRLYNDLDFLLKPGIIEKAISVLFNMGYVASYHEWPAKDKIKQLFLWHRHHFSIWHPEKDIVIELHWKPFFFHLVKADTIVRQIDSNLIQLEFAGRQFKCFNIELELLFLIVHGGLHDWKRLKWLVDIEKILQKYPIDEDKFQHIVKITNSGRMVALCNELLQEYYSDSRLLPQSTMAPSFLIRFAREQINQEKGVEYDNVRGFLKFYRGKLIAFPGLKYKLSVLKQLFFMPEDMDNERLPSNQLFFYLAGPFNKLKRRIRLSRKEKNNP